MPTADAHHAPAGGASRAGWIVCLLLGIALAVTAWFAWREGMAGVTGGQAAPAETRLDAEPDAEPDAELAALRKTIRELETVRGDLQALLPPADPCAIPEEIHGLILTPAAGQEPAAPVAPDPAPTSGQTMGQTIGQPDEKAEKPGEKGSFTASNDEIEAATILVLTRTSMGTGFFVAPGIVITNRHVVEEQPSELVLINKALGSVTRGELLAISREQERDYALIRVNADARSLPAPLPLCGTIKKTEKVGSWGYPDLLSAADPKFQALMRGNPQSVPEEVYSEGVVNVVYETAPPMILHTAPTSPGNSGGPLVNAGGCVVGISTMIRQDGESYRQTSIALSSRDLAAFLWQHGVNPRYSKGSD